MNRGRQEPLTHDLFEFFRIESRAATGAAQRERGTNDRRIVRSLNNRFGFGPRSGESSARHLQPGFVHRLLEEHAILGNLDRFALGPDHFHAAFFEHSRVIECDRKIQRSLSADRRQQCIGLFLANDCGN